MKYNNQVHPFHLVDPSPWPIVSATGAFAATFGGVMFFHSYQGGVFLLNLGLFIIVFGIFVWLYYTTPEDTSVYRNRILTYYYLLFKIFQKIDNLKSYFFNKVFINRPPYKVFLILIGLWVIFSIIISFLYDPIAEISPLWWLNTFLVIDGMVVCLFIPYRSIFKYILWYVFFSMIFATFILCLIFISTLSSYLNGELSILYTYENSTLEPLLGVIQEIMNTCSNPTSCAPGGEVPAARATASAVTNVAVQNNVTPWKNTVLTALLNGAAISSAAVAVGSASPRVKFLGVTAFAVGVAATYLSATPPTPTP